jgi:hypothetical protein
MIGLSQRPLPENTQDPQETDIHAQAGYEPAVPTSNRLQTKTPLNARTLESAIIIIIIIIIVKLTHSLNVRN